MTTASMNTKNVFDAKLAGVDCYLLKPFSPSSLAEKLAAMRSTPLPEVVQRDIRHEVDEDAPAHPRAPAGHRPAKAIPRGSVKP
jgi:hypothetical protein